MGDIGPNKKEIELEPFPATEPAKEPAVPSPAPVTPAPVPEEVPA